MRNLLICLTCLLLFAGATWVAFGQAKKPTTTTKKTAVPTHMKSFVLTWKDKKYKITADKPVPIQELNAEFNRAALVPGLQQQLSSARLDTQKLRANLSALSQFENERNELEEERNRLQEELEESKNDLEEAKNELEETKTELEEAKDELEELKEKVEEFKSTFEDVQSESKRLKRAIGDFSFFDWKTVVPDVQIKHRALDRKLFELELLLIGL